MPYVKVCFSLVIDPTQYDQSSGVDWHLILVSDAADSHFYVDFSVEIIFFLHYISLTWERTWGLVKRITLGEVLEAD
jgi:hypothetical protein